MSAFGDPNHDLMPLAWWLLAAGCGLASTASQFHSEHTQLLL